LLLVVLAFNFRYVTKERAVTLELIKNTMTSTTSPYDSLVNEALKYATDKKIPQACYQLALAINESINTKQLLQINSELPALLTQITQQQEKQQAQQYFESFITSSVSSLKEKNAANLCIAGLYEDEQTAFVYLNRIIDADDKSQPLTFVGK
jgi:uncharacterized membrane protein YheB (UPF0754 family)